eukprot:2047559-Alexandrium_andersonii.AAC.1
MCIRDSHLPAHRPRVREQLVAALAPLGRRPPVLREVRQAAQLTPSSRATVATATAAGAGDDLM